MINDMEATQYTSCESAILTRVIAPSERTLSESAARAILELEFPESDIARMNDLAAKNSQEMATPAEVAELEDYSRVGGLVNLLRAKARRSLA